jgi:histidinol-phosphate aminotransferase
MYGIFAQVNRCQVLSVPRRGDFSLDVAAITATVEESDGNARILFLVSPGNPDGQAIPLDTIRELLALPLIVAVDETYIEFGGETTVPLLPDHDNLIVIRTFSKWAGLAGLRLGYALVPAPAALAPRVAGWLERIRAPYNVNAAAMVAALATMTDLETVQSNVARLIAERERLQESLATLTWIEPLPSQANFILCRLKDHTSQDVVSGLARQGILVRGFSDPTMAEYVRIGVGRPEQNETLLAALRELGGEYER